MCDSKCLYIIGFDIHDNDGLREFFVECLDKNFHIERINQSCYKCKSDIPLRDFKTSLSGIIKDCIKQCGSFHEEDFIKLFDFIKIFFGYQCLRLGLACVDVLV